jgi:transposase-like protein
MNSKLVSIECPDCKSTRVNKNGHKAGKQNHICVDCGRQFIDCYQTQQGYAEEIKRECLSMYINGMGFRAILLRERLRQRANQGSTSHQHHQVG